MNALPPNTRLSDVRSAALRTLGERGYVNQCTRRAGLDELFEQHGTPVYIGFDATADSLHVGHYFSVNRMLSFDSVHSRLERQENLSFLEFNYMIFQAYDFLELFRRYGVRVQMGGADQ